MLVSILRWHLIYFDILYDEIETENGIGFSKIKNNSIVVDDDDDDDYCDDGFFPQVIIIIIILLWFIAIHNALFTVYSMGIKKIFF